MAGFRDFQTGEVLTAANVNDFLAKQAVMKFADAAARDAALGTAVAGGNALREGMVAYLDDEDLPSFYNGTTWTTEFGGGGLVAVKHALFTGTQTNSTAAGANFAITDLTITHEVADAANKLIVSGFVGVLDGEEQGFAGIAMAVDGSVVNVGDTASGKISTSTGGSLFGTGLGGAVLALPHSFTYVYTPGAGSKTYTLRAFNTNSSTETVYINRGKVDDARTGRGVSGLVIQEVKV